MQVCSDLTAVDREFKAGAQSGLAFGLTCVYCVGKFDLLDHQNCRFRRIEGMHE